MYSKARESVEVDVSNPRVLIVKFWALGDILMATPMLSALKRRYPGCSITWLTDTHYADILRENRYLDELISFDSGTWTRLFRRGKLMAYWKISMKLRRDLIARRFDIVINLTPEKWWSIWFMVAPIRIGLFPSNRHDRMQVFYTVSFPRSVDYLPSLHNSEHYMLPARALGCDNSDMRMSIGETSDEAPFLEKFWREHNLSAKKITIVFAPFSTGENRMWEPERMAALADRLQETYDAQIVIACGDELKRAGQILSHVRGSHIVLARNTTLREYIALLRRSDIVVCVDSSAMHIAAALDKPFVALFGPTPVNERFPMISKGVYIYKRIACSPCDKSSCTNNVFRECMKQIEVDDVVEAVTRLLDSAALHG